MAEEGKEVLETPEAPEPPVAKPAEEGTVAVPEKAGYGATDLGAEEGGDGDGEEDPMTSKGLKAKLAEKKQKEEDTKAGYGGAACDCLWWLAGCIGDILRTIPVFTLSGLALSIAGVVIMRVYSIKFETDIDIGSTRYYMVLFEVFVMSLDISAAVLIFLLSGKIREVLCLWCASSSADDKALHQFQLEHEKEDEPKPLPAEVFVHVHKAHSIVDGEEGDEDVYCKMYLVGDRLPFAVAQKFEEGEDEKSFVVPGLETGDEMMSRLVLEMIRTEGDQVIGAVEIVLHSTDLGMSAQNYDFLDAASHELTAQVKISFTKVGQSESSDESEAEADADPTTKNRTWTECCLDCIGYCGLEALLWVFMGLLYLAFFLTFVIVVLFSIVVTVMWLFDELCDSDSVIISVLDELSSTLSEFGYTVVDDSIDDTITNFCDDIDNGLGDMEWIWMGTGLLFFGQTHLLLAMTDRHRSAVDAVQVASLKQQVKKLGFMNGILSQQHHRDQHHRHHHNEAGLDSKNT